MRTTQQHQQNHHARQQSTIMSASTCNSAAEDKMRFAEHALLKKHGVQEITTELTLSLPENIPALYGITSARVLHIELPSCSGNTKGTNTSETVDDDNGGNIPLVMIHGGGGTPGDWMPLIPHLIQDQPGRSIYLVERPGNGLSAPMDYTNVDLRQFSAAFVEQVLKALQLPKVHLVGNSMGGATIVWYALQQLDEEQVKQQEQEQEQEQEDVPLMDSTPLQQQPHQQSTNNNNPIASISLVGVPAGYQGMNVPWATGLLQPWMGTIASFFPQFLPFVPLLILRLALNVPVSTISMVFLHYIWRAHSIRSNIYSFFTVMKQLYQCAYHGKGWKLEDLRRLSDSLNGNLLVLTGTGDPFITDAQHAEIRRHVGADKHLPSIGTGHCPWFVDPMGCAVALERFWLQAEDLQEEEEEEEE